MKSMLLHHSKNRGSKKKNRGINKWERRELRVTCKNVILWSDEESGCQLEVDRRYVYALGL
jgi:hypothetical protein